MGLIVVDASVVIAYRDAKDACHEAAKEAVISAGTEHRLSLPASAFSETMVRPLSIGLDADELTARLRAVFAVEPISESIGLAAAKLRVTSKLRWPDALVVATGVVLDADRILTFDAAWKKVDRRVRVLSPA